MIRNICDINIKKLIGEELTEDEVTHLKNYNSSYELVRFLVVQKLQAKGAKMQNFHFTPGESFLDTPIIDTVNGIIDILDKTDRGEIKPISVTDL